MFQSVDDISQFVPIREIRVPLFEYLRISVPTTRNRYSGMRGTFALTGARCDPPHARQRCGDPIIIEVANLDADSDRRSIANHDSE